MLFPLSVTTNLHSHFLCFKIPHAPRYPFLRGVCVCVWWIINYPHTQHVGKDLHSPRTCRYGNHVQLLVCPHDGNFRKFSMLLLDSFSFTKSPISSLSPFGEILGKALWESAPRSIPGFTACCPHLLLNQIRASANWRNELIIGTIQTKWKERLCYVGWIFRFKIMG